MMRLQNLKVFLINGMVTSVGDYFLSNIITCLSIFPSNYFPVSQQILPASQYNMDQCLS